MAYYGNNGLSEINKLEFKTFNGDLNAINHFKQVKNNQFLEGLVDYYKKKENDNNITENQKEAMNVIKNYLEKRNENKAYEGVRNLFANKNGGKLHTKRRHTKKSKHTKKRKHTKRSKKSRHTRRR